jgi:hypothetical protein
MQTFEFTAQLLEVSAGRGSQVLIVHRIVDHLQLAEPAGFEVCGNVAGAHIVDKKARSQRPRKPAILPRASGRWP